MPRHHDHRQVRPALAEQLQDLDAAAAGHRDVQQHEVGAALLHAVQGLVPAPRERRGVALVREDVRDGLADALLVVDDQDAHHELRFSRGAR